MQKAGTELRSATLKADAITIRPTRRSLARNVGQWHGMSDQRLSPELGDSKHHRPCYQLSAHRGQREIPLSKKSRTFAFGMFHLLTECNI